VCGQGEMRRPSCRERPASAAIAKWVGEEHPKIAAQAKEEGTEIQWDDETGLLSDHARVRCSAPKGKAPVAVAHANRSKLGAISTVTNKGQMRWKVFSGALNAKIPIGLMMRLVHGREKRAFQILDNLRVHPEAARTCRTILRTKRCVGCRRAAILQGWSNHIVLRSRSPSVQVHIGFLRKRLRTNRLSRLGVERQNDFQEGSWRDVCRCDVSPVSTDGSSCDCQAKAQATCILVSRSIGAEERVEDSLRRFDRKSGA